MTTAKHRGATDIALITPQDPSLLSVWVARYWKIGLGACIAASAVILVRQHLQTRSARADEDRWRTVRKSLSIDPLLGVVQAEEAPIRGVLADVKGTPVEPWVLLGLVDAGVEERDYDTVKDGLEQLRATHQKPLTADAFALTDGGEAKPLVDWLDARIQAQRDWEQRYPQLFANPPLPPDAPKVRLVTSAGDIVVGLYQAEAPKHVENFLKLCREGFYVGTKFHRVIPGFMIQGGDPNTKEADFATWGEGGPGYTLPLEPNKLSHFRGVLAAAQKSGENLSSGSQFYITTGEPHTLDGKYEVYGAVVEGMSTVEGIENGTIEDQQTSRPEKPIEILRTEVL
jgi:peptidyl-prolyl cis-trans isomerase B (cyclophilin B)